MYEIYFPKIFKISLPLLIIGTIFNLIQNRLKFSASYLLNNDSLDRLLELPYVTTYFPSPLFVHLRIIIKKVKAFEVNDFD
jgi:hypothetical protein